MIRNRYVLACDVPLIAFAAFGAFAIRFDWRFFEYRPEFLPYLAAALLIKPVVYFAFGLYQRVWRYAGIHDLVTVTLAVTAASIAMAILVAATHVIDPLFEFSRTIIVVDWLLSVAFVGGTRMSFRLISEQPWAAGAERRRPAPEVGRQKRLLIVGAGDAGAIVAREIQRRANRGVTAVGFLDDDNGKQGKWIHGLRVLGPLPALERLIGAHAIDEVLIAIPSAAGTVIRELAETCRKAKVVSRTMPGVHELIHGQVSVNRLRQIEITDLLRREPVPVDVDCSVYLASRRVLVTGAGGSIGQELCRQVASAGPERLVLLGHGENSLFECYERLREFFPGLAVDVFIADVRDRRRLESAFRAFSPDVVFHAAAHKHVPLMESNPEEAVTNNVVGTRAVVEEALAARVSRLVMISTDKAVAPTSIMGASKRLCEMFVRDVAVRHAVPYSVVRFGNVLGSRGSVVPHFQRQIERGGPVTITHPEMKRFFMTIPEAVHLVLQAAGLGSGGELFVLDMGEPIRIVDLARDMIKLSTGAGENIPIVFTGLRPGEKLEEKLWEEGAAIQPTRHPSVLQVIEPSACSGTDLLLAMDRLTAAADGGDRLAIEHALAVAISSYVPSTVHVHV